MSGSAPTPVRSTRAATRSKFMAFVPDGDDDDYVKVRPVQVDLQEVPGLSQSSSGQGDEEMGRVSPPFEDEQGAWVSPPLAQASLNKELSAPSAAGTTAPLDVAEQLEHTSKTDLSASGEQGCAASTGAAPPLKPGTRTGAAEADGGAASTAKTASPSKALAKAAGGGGAKDPAFKYRLDIDGLRCLAVFAVILYHSDHHWIPGGFVGVDIFFVISGYVVAGSLLRKPAPTKCKYFEAFYARRVKRLTPTLAFVVLVTSLAIGLLVPPHTCACT